MTVTALGIPVAAGAFVFASEPTRRDQPRRVQHGAAEGRLERADAYSMRRWRLPAERRKYLICAARGALRRWGSCS
jgi:hypothetical protein